MPRAVIVDATERRTGLPTTFSSAAIGPRCAGELNAFKSRIYRPCFHEDATDYLHSSFMVATCTKIGGFEAIAP